MAAIPDCDQTSNTNDNPKDIIEATDLMNELGSSNANLLETPNNLDLEPQYDNDDFDINIFEKMIKDFQSSGSIEPFYVSDSSQTFSVNQVPVMFDLDNQTSNENKLDPNNDKTEVDFKRFNVDVKDEIIDAISVSSSEEQAPLALEVIALSSIENSQNDLESISDGYHSSDFEFITEEEANLDGLIINFNPDAVTDKTDSNNNVRTVAIGYMTTEENVESRTTNDFYGAGPSTSRVFGDNRSNSDESAPNNAIDHVIPVGDNYFRLFQGNYAPILTNSNYFVLENKSVLPTSCMHVEFEGLGFDLRRHVEETSEDEEYRQEADECTQKILLMYPEENTRFKRRRRR